LSPAQHLLLLLLRGYHWLIVPARRLLLGPAPSCRFIPTCSVYAADAVRTLGAFRGGGFAVRRLCRCHPWGGFGFDPIPGTVPGHTLPPSL
jgi:hypothetical protein